MIVFEEYLGQQIDLRMEVYEEIKDEAYQQGRQDAIEECIRQVSEVYDKYPFELGFVLTALEQLKEQK